jgi:hypothetical protein
MSKSKDFELPPLMVVGWRNEPDCEYNCEFEWAGVAAENKGTLGTDIWKGIVVFDEATDVFASAPVGALAIEAASLLSMASKPRTPAAAAAYLDDDAARPIPVPPDTLRLCPCRAPRGEEANTEFEVDKTPGSSPMYSTSIGTHAILRLMEGVIVSA